MDKHYKGIEGRDIEWLDDQGGYYIRHVSSMTGEGLHSKADIAAELAYRDWRIDTADTELAAAKAKLAYFEELAGERLVQISDDAERIAALEKALVKAVKQMESDAESIDSEWGDARGIQRIVSDGDAPEPLTNAYDILAQGEKCSKST